MNRHSASGGQPPRSGEPGAPPGEPAGPGKRARILEAAIRVFADKGFYNAKVSEIARLAGVADGTIYLYFRSKDDLLISIFEDRMEQVNDNARAAVAAPGTPIERLRGLLRSHLQLVQSEPLLAEVLTVELRQSTKFLKEYRQSKFGEFLKLLAQPIEDGQRDGTIRADVDAPLVARALFGAVDELTLAWLLRPRAGGRGGRRGAVDLAMVSDQLGGLLVDGLRAPAGGAPSQPPSNEPTHAGSAGSTATTGNAGAPPGKRRAS